MAQLTNFKITWNFQEHVRGGSSTPGIDFGTPDGTPINPLFSGKVIFVGEDPYSINPKDKTKAKYVVIRADNGSGDWYYVHLSKATPVLGQHLDCIKDIVGYSGHTGNATGPHTHVGNRQNGKYVDFASRLKDAYNGNVEDPAMIKQLQDQMNNLNNQVTILTSQVQILTAEKATNVSMIGSLQSELKQTKDALTQVSQALNSTTKEKNGFLASFLGQLYLLWKNKNGPTT